MLLTGRIVELTSELQSELVREGARGAIRCRADRHIDVRVSRIETGVWRLIIEREFTLDLDVCDWDVESIAGDDRELICGRVDEKENTGFFGWIFRDFSLCGLIVSTMR